MGKEKGGGDWWPLLPEQLLDNNFPSQIIEKERVIRRTEVKSKNFAGVPLNHEFLEFEDVWEKKMIRKIQGVRWDPCQNISH